MSDERSYKNHEVQAIIDRALKTQPQDGTSHEDLLAIGAEVGLSRTAIEGAAREIQLGRADEEAKAFVLARRRRGFAWHAGAFVAVNAFLFLVNFLTTPGEWWFLFSLFGWGVGLLAHAAVGLSSNVSTRRLNRAKRRLQLQRADSQSERAGRVRVQGASATASSNTESADEAQVPEAITEGKRTL